MNIETASRLRGSSQCNASLQIGLGVVEPQLDGFKRGVRQALIDQHQLAQITGWNAERARRIADIGVVANERRGDNLDVQMRDGFRECALPAAPWSESLILGAINAMFASDDPRSPQRELEVRPPVDRPARPRMDTQWPVAIEPGETRRRCDRWRFSVRTDCER